jgi:hypothetical protein
MFYLTAECINLSSHLAILLIGLFIFFFSSVELSLPEVLMGVCFALSTTPRYQISSILSENLLDYHL